VKIAAYQAPLLPSDSPEVLGLIRRRVRWCEAEGITILCCPEAILGGLADYSGEPAGFAISADAGALDSALAPLASDTVTTIVGFTERACDGRLYNSAALFHRGSVAGVYRKLYPAINRSVYEAGREIPVFRVEELTLGIVICNDSNYFEPARLMAAQGAAVLFVPTNNALPPPKADARLCDYARSCDIARAVENGMWVVRADVAGSADGLLSYGSSGIVDPDGMVIKSAMQLGEDLIVAEIDTKRRRRRRGWDTTRNRAVADQYAAHLVAPGCTEDELPSDSGVKLK
jgi:predicted amidohydrolase